MTVMNEQAYRKVEEKIEAALRSQARELDISGGRKDADKLTKVPESLNTSFVSFAEYREICSQVAAFHCAFAHPE